MWQWNINDRIVYYEGRLQMFLSRQLCLPVAQLIPWGSFALSRAASLFKAESWDSHSLSVGLASQWAQLLRSLWLSCKHHSDLAASYSFSPRGCHFVCVLASESGVWACMRRSHELMCKCCCYIHWQGEQCFESTTINSTFHFRKSDSSAFLRELKKWSLKRNKGTVSWGVKMFVKFH